MKGGPHRHPAQKNSQTSFGMGGLWKRTTFGLLSDTGIVVIVGFLANILRHGAGFRNGLRSDYFQTIGLLLLSAFLQIVSADQWLLCHQ